MSDTDPFNFDTSVSVITHDAQRGLSLSENKLDKLIHWAELEHEKDSEITCLLKEIKKHIEQAHKNLDSIREKISNNKENK